MQATTVAALGEAETDYNLAGFTVSLVAHGTTVPTAKARLKKQVDALTEALDALKAKLNLTFVKNSIRASSNVGEDWQYNQSKRENEFKGYQATYQYSFQIDDMEQVSAVYDTLTSLQEVTTSSPHWSIKDKTRNKLNNKALKDAWAKVTERFQSECEILGLDAADFEIASWEVNYSDSQRSGRVGAHTNRVAAMRAASLESAPIAVAAAAPAGGGVAEDDVLELVVGKATVHANLEVGYARKANTTTTVKAEVVSPKRNSVTDNTTTAS